MKKYKKCSRCGMEKSVDEFHYKNTEKRYHSWCKKCLFNKQRIRWKDRKRKVIDLMGGKCVKCGYDRDMAALDLHHVDPSTKEYTWNRLRELCWDKVVKEIKKCILICSNCHREIHSHHRNLDFNDSGHSNNILNDVGRKLLLPTGSCPTCSGDVYGTKYCSVLCANIGNRRVKRPSKNELSDLIKTESILSLGRKYNVSDNAIRKWCRAYGLSCKKQFTF